MSFVRFNKPWGVLSRFTDADGHPGLSHWLDVPGVYPAGRLDRDSEGLLLLTDDGRLQARIAQPRHRLPKTYLLQVEGTPAPAQLKRLRDGVTLKDGPAAAVGAAQVDEPEWLWPRDPPVRHRLSVPTAWLEVSVDEGRNRLLRRMSAAVGLPTLRLVRTAIGPWTLAELPLGTASVHTDADAWRALDAYAGGTGRARRARRK